MKARPFGALLFNISFERIRMNKKDLDYCPSPQQIQEAMQEIKMGWSPREEERRRVCGRDRDYTVPFVETSDLLYPAEE